MTTCRDEVLGAFERLEARHGRSAFELPEIVSEVLSAGVPCAESTIRTHVTSRMCRDAPDHHASTFDDLERVDRGLYRRRQ
jgi:hypothetical protein